MNEIVTNLLESRLEMLETDIKWARNRLSHLAQETLKEEKKMDRLTTERRALRDALEVPE